MGALVSLWKSRLMNQATESLNGNQKYTTKSHIIEDDHHEIWSTHTPLRPDAFSLSNEEKKTRIAMHFREIMHTLGLDLNDDSLKGTPARVAKMYVEEIFSGLNPEHEPTISMFQNKYQYREMLVEKNIRVQSHCEHHFVPILGVAHVAYISTGKVVGLSKLNRLVDHYARRPQVQERLTMQIAEALAQKLDTPHVAVVLEAEHLCVRTRGIRDEKSSTVSSAYLGNFAKTEVKKEFLSYLR